MESIPHGIYFINVATGSRDKERASNDKKHAFRKQ